MRQSVIGFGLLWALVYVCALQGATQAPPDPLSKKHALLSGPEHCADCHDLAKGKPEFKCLNCHGGIREDQKSGRHPSLGNTITSNICAGCHSMHAAGGASSGEMEKQGKTGSPHGSIGIACRNCHTSTSFIPIRPFPDFKHSETHYPLSEMHSGLDCRQCHVKLVFANVGKQCVDCHADFHRRQLGSNCEKCHTARGWRINLTAGNSHTNRFPLIGAHAAVDCESCHKSAAVSQYRGLSTDCASCHPRDYAAAKSPDHQAAKFPTTCQSCHTVMDSWFGAKFDHSRYTGFLLLGGHAQVDCAACHKNGKFAGTSSDCVSCHTKDYLATANPKHARTGFPQLCSTCHNTTSWTGAVFNHSTALFSLTGAHTIVPCATCHKNSVYAGLPTACSSCHLTDYNSATNPNHGQAGFPQDCSLCHSTTSFLSAVFNHGTTPFPLTGTHTSVPCATCHKNNVYAGLSTACASCHLTDYSSTTNPKHALAGFPQLCSTCHNTTSWTGAVFNHGATPFPLTGAHTSVPCNLCHISGSYTSTPTDCYACHSAEYKSATNPAHQAAGFPTTCATCHTTTQWTGATFSHTWWPRNHGSAKTCSACHANPSDYSVFTCTGCHTKSQTDSRHSGRSGYVYNSANCYQCHR
jgi:hypothetical protein